MTPEEHIARAEDLARGAAALRTDYLQIGGMTHRGGPEGTELLAEMQALATLALTHATLATAMTNTAGPRRVPAPPRVPSIEILDRHTDRLE
jgi:hypothetical protein